MELLAAIRRKFQTILGDQQSQYWKVYLPVLAVNIPSSLLFFLAVYFAGHLQNDSVVTGVGIGQSTLYCLLSSSIMGFSLLFESYAGAIKSSDDPNKLGELLVKCSLQGGMVFLALVGPFLNIVHVISYLGEEKETHDAAKLFIRVNCFWPIFTYMQDLLVKYLIIQGYFKTPMVVGLSGLAVNALLSYLCIDVFEWGVIGFGVSWTLTPIIIITGTVLFCVQHKQDMLWNGISSEIWLGWGEMMKLGAFNSCRVLSGNSLYVLANIICQVGGPTSAATVIIVDKVNLLFNFFVYSGGSATAIILGTALGRKSHVEVKKAMVIGVINWAIERTFSLTVMFLTAGSIATLFTDTQTVLDGVKKAEPSMAFLYLLFGLDELLAQGILTPLGGQTLIGISATLSIFLVGYPMMFYMVYRTSTGAAGIFWCFVASYFVQCMVYVVRMAFIKIDREIESSSERVDRGFNHNSSVKENKSCCIMENLSTCEENKNDSHACKVANISNVPENLEVNTGDKNNLIETEESTLFCNSRVKKGAVAICSICFIIVTTLLSFL